MGSARGRILASVEQLIVRFRQQNPPDSILGRTSMMGRVCYGKDEFGNPMDEKDLQDNVLNMIFAGHDTTYASMGTALHYLSKNPIVCQELAKEVKSFRQPLDFDELKEAPLLNAFLAETWRIDPPVMFGFRKVNRETSYKSYTIPKGMIVRYDILSTLRNESVYPSAEVFDVQRYLPEDHPLICNIDMISKNVDYNSMKPNYPVFGGGSHSCLGSHFAKLEMRVFLTRMLRSYDVEVRNSKKVVVPVNGWKNEFKLEKTKKEFVIFLDLTKFFSVLEGT